ncbi:Integrase catalytic region [Denitrovibrio acetiphilus DSM 12809]|uniref:Integrase catalytic region n=1 Tax=Denitrovibrio acetiphilus (strain DSM 12809 / NBRC 114555 / N2460) TaxID=522772 RepID=D4H5C3_DENA2|nr:IS21 family transposase [Denitrovibrio acetiphilus]ADD67543.1 Integrase catalytic region [Denitrovibrio acetiphilus DSM 12809]
MLNKEVYFMIHTLQRQGYSQREIERMTGISRKTISKYLNLSDFPEKKAYPVRFSKLDPFKDYLNKRITSALPYKIPATVLIREIKEMGYDGGITILKDYIQKVRPKPVEEELVRFETAPGHQMQIDFATVKSGNKKLHVFVAELAYCRRSYTEFITDEKVDTFVNCHIKAFNYFGGVPKEILYDNAKAVVIQRDFYGTGSHKFQDMFFDMCRHYGTIPRLCKPYRAKTKGKVERFINYMKHSFYYPEYTKLRMNGLIMDMDTANIRVTHWNEEIADQRIHGTTGKKPIDMFQEEKEHLMPLAAPYTGTYPARATTIAEEPEISLEVPEIDVQSSSLDMYDSLIPTGAL